MNPSHRRLLAWAATAAGCANAGWVFWKATESLMLKLRALQGLQRFVEQLHCLLHGLHVSRLLKAKQLPSVHRICAHASDASPHLDPNDTHTACPVTNPRAPMT
jgi:hypothetical protein